MKEFGYLPKRSEITPKRERENFPVDTRVWDNVRDVPILVAVAEDESPRERDIEGTKIAHQIEREAAMGNIKRLVISGEPGVGKTIIKSQAVNKLRYIFQNTKNCPYSHVQVKEYDKILRGVEVKYGPDDNWGPYQRNQLSNAIYEELRDRPKPAFQVFELPAVGDSEHNHRGQEALIKIAQESPHDTLFLLMIPDWDLQAKTMLIRNMIPKLHNVNVEQFLRRMGINPVFAEQNLSRAEKGSLIKNQVAKMANAEDIKRIDQEVKRHAESSKNLIEQSGGLESLGFIEPKVLEETILAEETPQSIKQIFQDMSPTAKKHFKQRFEYLQFHAIANLKLPRELTYLGYNPPLPDGVTWYID